MTQEAFRTLTREECHALQIIVGEVAAGRIGGLALNDPKDLEDEAKVVGMLVVEFTAFHAQEGRQPFSATSRDRAVAVRSAAAALGQRFDQPFEEAEKDPDTGLRIAIACLMVHMLETTGIMQEMRGAVEGEMDKLREAHPELDKAEAMTLALADPKMEDRAGELMTGRVFLPGKVARRRRL